MKGEGDVMWDFCGCAAAEVCVTVGCRKVGCRKVACHKVVRRKVAEPSLFCTMKLLLQIGFCSLLATTAFAQPNTPARKAWEARPALALSQYTNLNPLSETRAWVTVRQSHNALLDENLREIELPKHVSVFQIKANIDLLTINYNHKSGLLNLDGQIIAPIEYDRIWAESSGIKLLKNNQLEWRDLKGKLLWQKTLPKNMRVGDNWIGSYLEAFDTEDRAGLIDTSGEWRITPAYSSISFMPNDMNYEQGQWRGIDDNYNRIHLLLPDRAWQSKNTYAALGPNNTQGFWAKLPKEKQFRFYDYQEKEQTQYGTLIDMSKQWPGYYSYWKVDSMGLMDIEGKAVLLSTYNYITPQSAPQHNQPFFQIGKDNQHGIWRAGKWILPVQYNRVSAFQDGFCGEMGDSVFVFDQNGGIIHRLGVKSHANFGKEWIWSNRNPSRAWHYRTGWHEIGTNIEYLDEQIGYLVARTKLGKHMLLDPNGKRHLEDVGRIEAMHISSFNPPPVFKFERALGRTGWIMPEQNMVQAADFEQVDVLRGGVFLVKKQFKYGLLDHAGKVLIPFEYDIKYDAVEDLVVLQKAGQWHCFNLKGQPLFGETFSELRQDYDCWGKTPAGWRLLSQDAKGQMATGRWPTIPRMRDRTFAIPQNGKYGLVDLDGTVIKPFEYDTLVHEYNYTWARKGQTIKVLHAPYDRNFEVEGQSLTLDHSGCYFVQRNGRNYIYTSHGKPLSTERYLNIQVQPAHKTVRYFAEKAVGEWHLLDKQGKYLHTINGTELQTSYHFDNAIDYLQGEEKHVYLLDEKKDIVLPYDDLNKIQETDLYIVRKEAPKAVMSQEYKPANMGIVDKDMKELLPVVYRDVNAIGNNHFIRTKRHDGRLGLYDIQLKVCIPEDHYDNDRLDFVGNNLFTVRRGKMVGIYIIDQKKWIPAAMEDIKSCNVCIPLGKAAFLVRQNGKHGLMDADCRDIVPAIYDEIREHSEVLLVLKTGKDQFLYHTLEQKMSPDTFDQVTWAGREHLIGVRGNRKALYRGMQRMFYRDGPNIELSSQIADEYYKITDHNTGKSGLLRADGFEVIPMIYDGLQLETSEIVFAQLGQKRGYLDINGKVLVPSEVSYGEVKNNIILAKNSDRNQWGAFDSKGKVLLPYAFDELTLGNYALHFIAKKNGKFRYFTLEGQPMHDTEWEFASEYQMGRAVVGMGGKYGFIDTEGKVVIPLQFRYADNFTGHGDNLYAYVIRDKAMERIDLFGKPLSPSGNIAYYHTFSVKKDAWYESATRRETPYESGEYPYAGYIFGKVKATQKTGILNILGDWVLPPEYDQILTSSNDVSLTEQNIALAYLQKNGKWGIVGFSGKILVPPTYDTIVYSGKAGQFEVTLGGKTALITLNDER